MEWYKREGRDLPWRKNATPYKVWISEIMLQQTRVDTGVPYFLRFIDQVPTIRDLAKIDEDNLLKLWQGLGYYSRALNLKKAAQMILERYDGEIPQDIKELRSLPGIGPYTAGAIASIAFGQPASAVDGNVLRILSRIVASKEDIGKANTKKEVEKMVEGLLPEEDPGGFNQALMDLGAIICLPGRPKCEACPVSEFCQAYLQGLTSEIPVKTKNKARAIEKRTVMVIHCKGRYALRKRAAKGLLQNLWEFPNDKGLLTEDQCRAILGKMGVTPNEITEIKTSKHVFSHLEWHMRGFYVEAAEIERTSDFVWVTKEEMKRQYSIPAAFKAYTEFIMNNTAVSKKG